MALWGGDLLTKIEWTQFALVELFLLVDTSALEEWHGEVDINCIGISFGNLNLTYCKAFLFQLAT